MSPRTGMFALLGVAGVMLAGYLIWKRSAGEVRLVMDPERMRREYQEMKDRRADQPAEAIAYFVNRRTSGWVNRPGSRQIDPAAIARPLDSRQYVAALAHVRGMTQYSTATRSVLTSQNAGVNAPAGGTLGAWTPLGPNNQGGRTRQLLIHPSNPSIMYAASAGGGVWKSTDAGANWVPLTDLALPNIAITALAFEPGNYNKIYAGTGEGFLNIDAIRGAGIFVTTDGGQSWSQLASTNNADFQYVNDIVVSPRNKQRIYAATRAGVFRSNDGGSTWTNIASGPNGCGDLAIQMNRATGYVFAACGLFVTNGDVKRALDANTGSMAQVFTTANMSRSTLAIAQSNESIVYAMASHGGSGSYSNGVLGIFRSTTNGAPGTWTTRMTNDFSTTDPVPLNNLLLTNPVFAYTSCVGGQRGFFSQGWYDQSLAVDPVDPNRLWAGGIDLFRSDDGGQTFGVASYWWGIQGASQYAHADQHAIAFHPGYDGTANRIMYAANDGGLFRTNDARANTGHTVGQVCGLVPAGFMQWTELNNGYSTMQFYHGTPYPKGDAYFGGAQDNGTRRGTTGNPNWSRLLGGDGGFTAVDERSIPADNVLFGEFTNLSLKKSTDNGSTWADAITGITESRGNFAFINPFHLNPGNPQHLWTGGFFIWRTTNQASSWSQASAVAPGSGNVSAIASSNLDPNKVVFGTSDGYIGYDTGALAAGPATSWSSTRPRTESVTSLAYDPSNSNTVWATYGAFSGGSVYKSTNSGATWTAMPGTGANTLPQVPAFTVVVAPTDSHRVYIGTDVGVFTTIDGGVNWYKEVTGFANVSVEWLAINPSGTKQLYAFTHGRGAWRVNLIP